MASMEVRSVAERVADLCVEAQCASSTTLARLAAEYGRARVHEGQSGDGFAALAYGAVLLQMSDGMVALEVLAEAEAIATRTGDAPVRLEVLVSKAKALTITGDLQRALECFREGLELARHLGDRHTEAVQLTNLGYFHGQLDESIPYEEYTRIALGIFRELGDRMRVALCLNNLAGSILRRERFVEALGCYEEAYAIALEIGWRRGQALILGGHGGMLLRQGAVAEGLQKYARSNAILEEVGDVFQLTRHQGMLGGLLLGLGRAAEAIPFLAEAVHSASARYYEVELAQGLQFISQAYEAIGDLPAALQALRRHFELSKAGNDRRNEDIVRNLKFEHRMAVARREAEAQESKNAELASVNAALTESLGRQVELQAELERLVNTDLLTGLSTRRNMQAIGEREIARSLRTHRPLVLMIADADHFKRINDRHGHAVGDEVLVEIGARLRNTVRTVDAVARWGGEEFCLLLVETDLDGAVITAERLRRAMSRSPFETSAGPLTMTLSIGIAVLHAGTEGLSCLLLRADAALYAAKNLGRDRYFVAKPRLLTEKTPQ